MTRKNHKLNKEVLQDAKERGELALQHLRNILRLVGYCCETRDFYS